MSTSLHRLIERALIAGILLGIFGMFQPWLLDLFQYGFLLLLISTVGFTVWSHVIPKSGRVTEDVGPISVAEVEAQQRG